MGGASAMVQWQSRAMAVCCGCLLLVVVCCGVVRESYIWNATKITNAGAKSCTNQFGCQITIRTMAVICTGST